MVKTVTFTDVKKRSQLTVKEEFLTVCPEPHKYTLLELNRDYNMLTYLHNENGPAHVKLDGSFESYWLDGRSMSVENPELAEKMKARIKFENKFEDFISGPDESGSTAS